MYVRVKERDRGYIGKLQKQGKGGKVVEKELGFIRTKYRKEV